MGVQYVRVMRETILNNHLSASVKDPQWIRDKQGDSISLSFLVPYQKIMRQKPSATSDKIKTKRAI